jgi:shikimate kinase
VSGGHHLVLVGMMGAGKTSVGRVCAQRLKRDFVDTDQLVEAREGATVAEIFSTRGEPAFRALERDAVAVACGAAEPAVIACGGGVVLDPQNRETLRAAGCVVWLRADAAALGDRVRKSSNVRPLIATDGAVSATDMLERIASDRAVHYDEVADLRVDTDGRSVAEVADVVLEEYGR